MDARILKIDAETSRPDLPPFRAGDTVRVHLRIKEGDKERTQAFQGTVIAVHKNHGGSTFTVRKVSYGVGVERIIPFGAPALQKVEVTSEGRVRRAKLYYLRERKGKAARIRERGQATGPTAASQAAAPSEQTAG